MRANKTEAENVPAKTSGGNRSEYVTAILLALTVAILTFFTYDQYYLLTAAKTEEREALAEKGRADSELAALKELQVRSQTPAMKADIERYAAPYREDAILSSLFPSPRGNFAVSVTMAKGQKLPIGLSSTEVGLSVRSNDREAFLEYLRKATDATASKRYFIKRVSFPFDTKGDSSEAFNATVTFGLYYYSK